MWNKIDIHELIDILITTLNVRNQNTFGHSWRVAKISTMIAESLELNSEEIEEIHIAAHLHDIGKIGIPDNILNKPGKLTAKEVEQIQDHPKIGYDILTKVSILENISSLVLYHHERFDGLGYPEGLKGKDIPLASRIITVADAFDAMTSDRPYRQALDYEYAFEEINNHISEQFCPTVVQAFNQIKNDICVMLENMKDDQEFIFKEFNPIEHERLIHSKKIVHLNE
ncbi:HD-GYP domain-containing protein [Selenihalanaerobacter shriftii]|uniref:HDIG domain-containing protein n=1 Tax=Selenihalanaerobacter shriftii TaxID=142842 RepID=A0A1T4KDR3_9FIRM|nr:HD-GYP domain-containing protein [Selenihalanaerobacter shriftii]SJZ40483.1 HDIG domain-containing protein [Selenihalanaerobacter shriftii]